MRTFQLFGNTYLDKTHRCLAEVVEFSDGQVVARWLGETASIVLWKSLDDFKTVSCSMPGRELIEG